MKQSGNREYSVQSIFKRSLICNTIYFICCAVFSVLILQNNKNNSQEPTPLLFFLGAVAALIFCVFELFLRDEQDKKFLPIAKFWIFYGKIFLFCVFEAVMIIFRSLLVTVLTVTVLPVIFIAGIWLIYRKHLNSENQLKLYIKYAMDFKNSKKTYTYFAILYIALMLVSVVWLILEIVLISTYNGGISIGRVILSGMFIIIFLISAIICLRGR